MPLYLPRVDQMEFPRQREKMYDVVDREPLPCGIIDPQLLDENPYGKLLENLPYLKIYQQKKFKFFNDLPLNFYKGKMKNNTE